MNYPQHLFECRILGNNKQILCEMRHPRSFYGCPLWNWRINSLRRGLLNVPKTFQTVNIQRRLLNVAKTFETVNIRRGLLNVVKTFETVNIRRDLLNAAKTFEIVTNSTRLAERSDRMFEIMIIEPRENNCPIFSSWYDIINPMQNPFYLKSTIFYSEHLFFICRDFLLLFSGSPLWESAKFI